MIIRLDIEDELVAHAEMAAKQQGLGFNEFVSAALRGALAQVQFAPLPAFTQKVHDFGTHIESPWSLLVDIETNAAVMQK